MMLFYTPPDLSITHVGIEIQERFGDADANKISEVLKRVRARQELRRLAALDAGWDGDDAPAPAAAAIANANRLMDQLEASGLNSRISPDVDGGIVITVPHTTIARRFVALSCDNDGEIYLILEAPPDAPSVQQLDHTSGLSDDMLRMIAAFVGR